MCQLNREVEKRGDKRPQLADLRESGGLEQDADVVLFLVRPEYYGIMAYDDGAPTRGRADIIIAKNRDGSTGNARVYWDKQRTMFVNESTESDNFSSIEYNEDFF